jgi:uncharacterized protein HemY
MLTMLSFFTSLSSALMPYIIGLIVLCVIVFFFCALFLAKVLRIGWSGFHFERREAPSTKRTKQTK